MEGGRVDDGEGGLVATSVAGDGEGVGAPVGTEIGEDRVAGYAIPKILCRVAEVGIDDGDGTAVATAGTGGRNDDEGIEDVDVGDGECVDFGTAKAGSDLENVLASLGDVGVGYATVGYIALEPMVGATYDGTGTYLDGVVGAGGEGMVV